MNMKNVIMRVVSKYRRTLTKHLYCRMVSLKANVPIISFSFDDAPRTAIKEGGAILKSYGATATFYVCLGLLDTESPSGIIASKDDLIHAMAEGHELGCHTYDHKHSWETNPDLFVQSVLRNRKALSQNFSEMAFTTLAYPICGPRPATKRKIGKLFQCCRGGGQTFNIGTTDLNLLKAFFLDIRLGDTIETIRQLIDKNAESQGWLIFATHDIDDNPSCYGCSKKFFEKVVTYAAQSGALLLPVGKACEQIEMIDDQTVAAPQY